MTVLPSPVPHPLDFGLPEVLSSVVGREWPTGDEVAIWDIADRWYAAARALAGPHDEAVAAAGQIDNQGFRDAWRQLAGDSTAPLNALVEIADSLGALVEDCGRALEAAKLRAWIEIGLFLTELTGMRVAAALSMGAATPAADGLVASTRITVLEIFGRLVAELGGAPRPKRAEPGTRTVIIPARGRPTVPLQRAPLAVHQKALENAMPPGASRLADPRHGDWFALINGGGPESDPTRGLNCVDAVLALYDTYLQGRRRVAAPRTFDSYAHGEPDRPIGGEWLGVRRIEKATGASFQNLCPFLGDAGPETAKPAVDAAMRNLANHLHNSGHGAFAVILTDLAGGGCHVWAAVNHSHAILFLDPQMGLLSEDEPLYHHRGAASAGNVVSMDALVVDARGRPAPLPYHGPGQWTAAV
ncbi:toxin glutamine deamidase domain-containing protein [Actinoplanes sp. CA-142083]|uniref:toxin glutamine deamidase domain-containing protein n=1 Tax=Actinoplanes sp. CA-142083 TaxID=3239903 RepID=UPI003D8A2C64